MWYYDVSPDGEWFRFQLECAKYGTKYHTCCNGVGGYLDSMLDTLFVDILIDVLFPRCIWCGKYLLILDSLFFVGWLHAIQRGQRRRCPAKKCVYVVSTVFRVSVKT